MAPGQARQGTLRRIRERDPDELPRVDFEGLEFRRSPTPRLSDTWVVWEEEVKVGYTNDPDLRD